ncbi:MAG: DeoR/GlpR transcriptional regulator [Roseibium sp.]|nr:DeoR/GlpR transcriptional regulator [Roseibium sp.]
MKKPGNSRTRQSEILQHLKHVGSATVEELAELFRATRQTIRKDLTTLSEANQISRFHGGAALLAGTVYTGLEARREIARAEKEQIGRSLAARIPNNSSVILNAGTTTEAAIPHLEHHLGLKIVTDSVHLADKLRHFSGVEVMIPAGVIRGSDGVVLGESAVEFIRQFRADFAIVGTAAIASDGALLDYDLREASVTRAIIAAARHVFLAADCRKFGHGAPVCFGHLDQIDTLITDSGASKPFIDACQKNGVEVVIADRNGVRDAELT